MKLYEYQAKEIFAKEGIPIPRGKLSRTPEEVVETSSSLGYPVMLKSQVLEGGRGKAGLIRRAGSPEEARRTAEELFQSKHRIKQILVEQAVDIRQEFYLAFTVEPIEAKALLLASSEGGMDIEEIASRMPEKIQRVLIDLDTGFMPFHARTVLYEWGIGGELGKQVSGVLEGLWRVFRRMDAELVEINPLFVTAEGQVIAGDGKLSIDDNSMFRHGEYEPEPDYFETPTAYAAYKEGIPYLQFDGEISLMCAGAGLTTTVYDLIHDEGGTVANYLEFGGPNYRKAMRAMELCLQNKPRVVLIVSFGTIARADVMAEGIAEAASKLKPDCPIITCIRGTGEEKAQEILRNAGLKPLFDTEEAVRQAVAFCKGGTV
jgi:succinyl-CoA synthetase beta subunit